MNIETAKAFVDREIARIESQNPGKELRPWDRDACPAASEHWGLIQQKIALSHSNPQNRACCENLNLTPPDRTPAQKAAAAANGRRLATAKAAA